MTVTKLIRLPVYLAVSVTPGSDGIPASMELSAQGPLDALDVANGLIGLEAFANDNDDLCIRESLDDDTENVDELFGWSLVHQAATGYHIFQQDTHEDNGGGYIIVDAKLGNLSPIYGLGDTIENAWFNASERGAEGRADGVNLYSLPCSKTLFDDVAVTHCAVWCLSIEMSGCSPRAVALRAEEMPCGWTYKSLHDFS